MTSLPPDHEHDPAQPHRQSAPQSAPIPPYLPPPGSPGDPMSPSFAPSPAEYGIPLPPEEQPKAHSRRGMILGIGIPVAVVLIAAIVAAMIVPQVLRQQRIDAAVEQYEHQHAQWEQSFTPEMLGNLDAMFADINPSETANGQRTVLPDSDGYVAAGAHCAQLDGLQSLHAQLLHAPIPERPDLSAAVGQPLYDDIVSRYQTNQPRYEASSQLLMLLGANAESLAEACEYTALFADAWDARTAGVVSLEARASAIASRDSYRLTVGDDIWEVTCTDSSGCFDPQTTDAREHNAAAWEDAYVTYARTLADLFAADCPTGLSEACSAEHAYWTERTAKEQAIADALRDDPRTQIRNHSRSDHAFQEALTALRDWNSSTTLLDDHPDVASSVATDFEERRDALIAARDAIMG